MTRLRQTVAKRLKEAQNNAAMLTTFNDVDMSAVMAARAKYKDLFEKKHGIRLGFMGFFVKAAALALQRRPRGQRLDRRRGDRLSRLCRRLGRGLGAAGPGRAGGPRRPGAELRRDREDDRRFRQARQGRHADDRGDAGRHLHHLQRRRVRLPAVDPDHQPAAIGGARHAPDRGAAGRRATARSSPGR